MPSQTADRNGVGPVLYIGSAQSAVVARLRACGVGVIVAERPHRGLRLLRHFVVAGVVYDVPALTPVLDFVALGTPVILLGAEGTDWGTPEVRVLGCDATAATLMDALQSFGQATAAV